MTPTDTPLRIALDAAVHQVQATLGAVAGRVSETLGTMSQSSGRIAERDLMISTQFDLRRNLGLLNHSFADELGRRVDQALSPRNDGKRTLAAADWQTLSLVDDSEMEERMFSDRIGQQISHACDIELRELAAYMGSLLQTGRADQESNPLRAEVLGAALYRAIEAVSPQADARKLLAREFGAAMAKAMPECYRQILGGLQNRGVQPVVLRVSQVEGPGNQLPGLTSGYAGLSSTRSQHAELDTTSSSGAGTVGGEAATSQHGQHGQRSVRGGASGLGAPSTSGGGYPRAAPSSRAGLSASQTDAQLMALLRHLSAVASRPGELDPGPRATGGGGRPTGQRASGSGAFGDSDFEAKSVAAALPIRRPRA